MKAEAPQPSVNQLIHSHVNNEYVSQTLDVPIL